MEKFYAGIGSRAIDDNMYSFMKEIGEYLSAQDYILRSGAADGSDSAFEEGTDGEKEIFLPWKGFNNSKGIALNEMDKSLVDKAIELVSQEDVSPAVHNLIKIENRTNKQDAIIKLHARNAFQVLGKDLETPAAFVVCVTPDGAISREDYQSGVTGGTGVAINLAEKLGIPVFNLNRPEHYERLKKQVDNFLQEKNKDKKKENDKEKKLITDVGVKVPGANKDSWGKFRVTIESSLSNDELNTLSIAKILPKPNYNKLIKSGINSTALCAIKTLYDFVPRRPGKRHSRYQIESYIDEIKDIRDDIKNIIDDPDNAFNYLDEHFLERANLYQEIGFPDVDVDLKTLKIMKMSDQNKAKFDLNNYIAAVNKKKSIPVEDILVQAETREEILEQLVEHFSNLGVQVKTKRKIDLDVYYKTKDRKKTYFIAKKAGKEIVSLKEGFDSYDDAKNYLKKNNDALVEKFCDIKNIPNHRRKVNGERVGFDYRKGEDISSELFRKTFGLKSVEFGNSSLNSQKETQVRLNETYDALLDMAKIMNISAAEISFDNKLSFAFGSRGKGGKNPAMAHYEASGKIINLTKNNGSGSISHEYFHFIDNVMSELNNLPLGFYSNNFGCAYDQPGKLNNIKNSFRDLDNAINKTKIKERSLVLDKYRGQPYWSTKTEIYARAFESFILSQLKANDQVNDMLVNIKEEAEWCNESSKESGYPYLLKDEVLLVEKEFKKVMKDLSVIIRENNNELSP